jgi:hypothetical protein
VGLDKTVASGPMTYSIDGHQYVAVCSGNSLYVFGLPEEAVTMSSDSHQHLLGSGGKR